MSTLHSAHHMSLYLYASTFHIRVELPVYKLHYNYIMYNVYYDGYSFI